MNLIDRVLSEPEFQARPPVLLDVGAAGGVNPVWRKIARYCIGIGFEPDARESAPLAAAHRQFRRWIFCRQVALPDVGPNGNATLYLTRSPQCSSALLPQSATLREWVFADFFAVQEERRVAATTLMEALGAAGVAGIDWLKCDTQGLDLKLFRSLPGEVRSDLLALEFEPGLIDAYQGEDKLADILAAIGEEPFWLAELRVGKTPRGRAELLAGHLGAAALPWVRRLGPAAPAWVNVRFLRDPAARAERLDRRAHLLSWVFAAATGQHGAALTVASLGQRRFGGPLMDSLVAGSVRRLRWSMAFALPRFLWMRTFPARVQ